MPVSDKYKPLAYSTLWRKTKEELIILVRTLENNWMAAENRSENQYKLIIDFMKKEKVKE